MKKIIGEKSNHGYLLLAFGLAILQAILFKLAYPFPDFISDSYNYIESAALHLNVNLWPVGYAKFLWLVHQINPSDTFLFCIQYFILQAALAYLFFFILWQFRPSRTGARILFVFLLVNPFSLYISNAILSDALFTAISIIWLIQLIRQFVRPSVLSVFSMAVLVGIAFTVRYTAVYYPIITGLALLISQHKKWVKIAGILAPVALMLPYVVFTKTQTKAVTGTGEFSVFGGWQLANNAIYMYDHIQVDPKELPAGTQSLDSMVRRYFKIVPPGYINLDDFPGTFFIKHSDAPLKQFMLRHYRKELATNSFLAWGKVSPIYNTYGSYLIRHYPIAFARYYLWLNTKNYFDPYLEKFDVYNLREDSIGVIAQYWFHLKTRAVRSISKDFQGKLFYSYSPLFLLLNIYFSVCFIWLRLTGKIQRFEPVFQKALYFLAGFLLINFAFSIFATPVVLRYQLVPLVFLFVFSTLLLEFTDQKEFNQKYSDKEQRQTIQVEKVETRWLTFVKVAIFGFLGAIFCLLVFVVTVIINLMFFISLMAVGFSSLAYGYLLRNFRHFVVQKNKSKHSPEAVM